MLAALVGLYAALSVAAHESNEQITIAAAYAFDSVECHRTLVRGPLSALPSMLARAVRGPGFTPLGNVCGDRWAGFDVRAGCNIRIEGAVAGQERRVTYAVDSGSFVAECRRAGGESQVY